MLVRATAGLLAAALVLPVFADPPARTPRAPVQEKAAADKPDLAKQLAARVAISSFDCSFAEALKTLTSAYALPVVLDQRLRGPEDPRENRPVVLPKLTHVRLGTVLDLLAEQVDCKVIVYPDHIKVVPTAHWAYETAVLSTATNPNDPNEEPALLSQNELVLAKPLTQRAPVSLTFRAKPLTEALDEIAEATGANVVLSLAVPADVRKAPVTARFASAPVGAAVRTLCELTDLGTIEEGNVLIVTTRARAVARAKADLQTFRDRQPPVPPWAWGFGGFAGVQGILGFSGQLGFGGQPAPPMGGAMGGAMGAGQPQDDVMKLKAQNEELRKELEELKKALKK